MNENALSEKITGCCIRVHKILGPGLLESVYEKALIYELAKLGIKCSRQKEIPMKYQDFRLNIGFIADIVVEDKVIIELKSVDKLSPLHHKQLLTYLKLTHLKLGLLINFNVTLIKDGVKRIANNL